MADLWPFAPLLAAGETLEWKTEILGGYSAEMRLKLRGVPRQTFSYTSRLTHAQFAVAKAFAQRNAVADILVPVWAEAAPLSVTLAGTETSLTFDTTDADYRAGGSLVLWQSDTQNAVAQIDTLSGTGVTLAAAIGTALLNPVVAPLRTARAFNGFKFTRLPTYTTVSADFRVRDTAAITGSAIYPQYQGMDVLTDRTVTVANISESIERAATYVDNGFGPVESEPLKIYADFGQTLGFRDRRRAGLWTRRRWLHSLAGKQKTFWLPSYNADLSPTADIGSSATAITVRSIAPTDFYIGKSVMLLKKDGTAYYRTISSASSLGGGVDQIEIDSALGAAVAAADIDVFSFLSRVRLDSDSVSFDHGFGTSSTSSMPVVEVPA